MFVEPNVSDQVTLEEIFVSDWFPHFGPEWGEIGLHSNQNGLNFCSIPSSNGSQGVFGAVASRAPLILPPVMVTIRDALFCSALSHWLSFARRSEIGWPLEARGHPPCPTNTLSNDKHPRLKPYFVRWTQRGVGNYSPAQSGSQSPLSVI